VHNGFGSIDYTISGLITSGTSTAAIAKFYYTLNGGTSWVFAGMTSTASDLTPGSHIFSLLTVPVVTTPMTKCKIKVELRTLAGALLATDMSDTVFTIAPSPPSPHGLTIFSGGTLADLQKLSPNLTFDELEITGKLILPSGSTTITANKLTIPSNGGDIEYTYGTDPVAAPNLTLNVSGDVVIDGQVYLKGQNGERVANTAQHKSCVGQRGGDITITGATIKMTGAIVNDGGWGSWMASPGSPDSPCKAGNSGNVKLAAAANMDMSGTTISNSAGAGPGGTSGYDGGSGTVNIVTGGAFTMKDGKIVSTGAMTFIAATTDIWATIHYGSLTETIGGAPDSTNPTITVLSSKITATYSENTEVKVQASDVGMGLRGVRLQGLGNDTTYDIADCGPKSALCTASALDSKLTMSFYVNDATSPNTLQVIAIDNKGNTTTVPVTGIMIGYPAEMEPNDIPPEQAQTLKLYGGIEGNIQTGDAGFTYPQADPIFNNKEGVPKMEDWYKVTCCEEWTSSISDVNKCDGSYNSIYEAYTCCGIRISLDFSGSASMTPDIDAFLIDNTGTNSPGHSKNDNPGTNDYTEKIVVPLSRIETENYYAGYCPYMGATYYVAVQAWYVPMRATYRIKYGEHPQ
jgi:hypothetical protein